MGHREDVCVCRMGGAAWMLYEMWQGLACHAATPTPTLAHPSGLQFAKEVAHLEWRYRRAKMVGMEAG